MSKVKERLSKFPPPPKKKHIELNFNAPSCKAIHPNVRHPSSEGRWWCSILNVRLYLNKGEILWSHSRFREGTHKPNTKLNRARAEVANAYNPFRQCILHAHVHANTIHVKWARHFVRWASYHGKVRRIQAIMLGKPLQGIIQTLATSQLRKFSRRRNSCLSVSRDVGYHWKSPTWYYPKLPL